MEHFESLFWVKKYYLLMHSIGHASHSAFNIDSIKHHLFLSIK